MKYFRLNNAFEKKDVGRIDGLKNFESLGYWDTEDSFTKQGRDSRVIGNPALPFPEMYKSVKMNDFINIIVLNSKVYPVISKRFLIFLEQYIKGDYQTWKINVKKGDVIYEYYILHIDNPNTNFADYKKSQFKLFKLNDKYQFDETDRVINIIDDKHYFETAINYTSLKIGSESLKPTKMTFKTSNNQDFFRCISAGYYGYYVSEKLKNEIEKQGFTGMIFEELEDIYKNVEIVTE